MNLLYNLMDEPVLDMPIRFRQSPSVRHDVSHDGKKGICSLCVLFRRRKTLYAVAVNKEVSRKWI